MSDRDAVERVWELMRKVGFCMLATHDDRTIRARPMAAHLAPEDDAVYFLTDVDSHKDDEIAANPQVCLAFADTGAQKYVSLTGHATVSNDREKIRELWSTPARAWWDSPDDPAIRVLKVAPQDAQYWDSPGTVMSYVKMLGAVVAGTRPDLGDTAKVRL